MPSVLEEPPVRTKPLKSPEDGQSSWLIFVYSPAALFSLKASWATSTAGKTLVTPTPYTVKMAFLDVALRAKLVAAPDSFVRALAKTRVRIGLPNHACVTESVQRIRQETRDADRKKDPSLPPYRPNVALRQMVHYQGELRFAFERGTCTEDVARTLMQAAPAVNYIGKRGGFVQYLERVEESTLDASFTSPVEDDANRDWGHQASLDDFGPQASFDALNSYTAMEIKRGKHRIFVETHVPLGTRNLGPGFTHYALVRSTTL